MTYQLIEGDCLEKVREMPDNSVDLVFTSPPYEDCRTYGIGFNLKGQEWVDWAVERYMECVRVTKGLVCWVVEGKTRKFQWSATPALLMADLHRKGVKLRKPPIYYRSGIPGSGGPDWLRNDYEFIVCSSKCKLPWSDNTACGDEPKFGHGGDPTNRTKSGKRVRVSGRLSAISQANRPKGPGHSERPDVPHATHGGRSGELQADGSIVRKNGKVYLPPAVANPGNVVFCSGGHCGSKLAHENEAPFPEKLAEFFIKSFCPPDGVVLDPFCGSGTTLAVAEKHGRNSIGIDIRANQIDLSNRRIESDKNDEN